MSLLCSFPQASGLLKVVPGLDLGLSQDDKGQAVEDVDGRCHQEHGPPGLQGLLKEIFCIVMCPDRGGVNPGS